MIPPRPSLFTLLTLSLAITACAAPPPDFHTYRLGETPPPARAAKARKHHPPQQRKGQKTTASTAQKKSTTTAPQREPLVRWWMFKPEERSTTVQGKRGVAQNPRAKTPPAATSNNRAVAQAPKAKAKAAPAPATNKRAVVQNSRTAPAPVKGAAFGSRKAQSAPAPTRQQPVVAKNMRKPPAPIAVQANQPPLRSEHPDRTRARSAAASQYPVAKKSMQDGYVVSPYTRAKINVKRVPHGAQVLDPSSEKVFINP